MPTPPFSLDLLRKAIRSGRFKVQYHARERLRERGFSIDDLLEIVLSGDVIESYPTSKPDPKCLFMKRIRSEPSYVVVAFDEKSHYAYIITIHGYNPGKWIDPWTRRQS